MHLFRGGLVFKAQRRLYHSNSGLECNEEEEEVPRQSGEAHASNDHTLAGPFWEGYRESRWCSRDTFPESYITKYTSIRRQSVFPASVETQLDFATMNLQGRLTFDDALLVWSAPSLSIRYRAKREHLERLERLYGLI